MQAFSDKPLWSLPDLELLTSKLRLGLEAKHRRFPEAMRLAESRRIADSTIRASQSTSAFWLLGDATPLFDLERAAQGIPWTRTPSGKNLLGADSPQALAWAWSELSPRELAMASKMDAPILAHWLAGSFALAPDDWRALGIQARALLSARMCSEDPAFAPMRQAGRARALSLALGAESKRLWGRSAAGFSKRAARAPAEAPFPELGALAGELAARSGLVHGLFPIMEGFGARPRLATLSAWSRAGGALIQAACPELPAAALERWTRAGEPLDAAAAGQMASCLALADRDPGPPKMGEAVRDENLFFARWPQAALGPRLDLAGVARFAERKICAKQLAGELRRPPPSPARARL